MSIDKTAMAKKIDFDSAPARKFMFDQSFDDDADVHRSPERRPVLVSPDQLDALKKEAYDSGMEAGRKAGKEEQLSQQNGILAKIDQSLNGLVKGLAAIAREQEDQTRRLSIAIAKKILPHFTEQNGTQEIEALVGETLREMAREPRLVVRVAEPQFDALNEKIQALATAKAFSGKVVILADSAVAGGDCRIEWADGGIERNTEATLKTIEQTVLPPS